MLATTASHALAWWSSYYGDHQAVSVTLLYLHLAALVVGGGAAITFDQQVRRARRRGEAVRAMSLDLLASSHRVVVPSLVVMVTTGLMMTAADVETYFASPLFWSKMALIGLLVVNGALLVSGQRLAEFHPDKAWRRLGLTSRTSQALWLLIVLVSCWLVVAA